MGDTTFLKKNIPKIVWIALGGICASLAAGQLVRFPLPGQGGGILISDIALLGFLLVAGILIITGRVNILHHQSIIASLAIAPFLLWGLCVLLGHSGRLNIEETRIAFLYWVRLAAVLGTFPIIAALRVQEESKNKLLGYISYTYITLLFLGYLQFISFPSLSKVQGGWDPHNARMFASWLDPNFFGAFLAMFLPLAVARTKSKALLFFAVPAIVLTMSRSVYISTFAALAVCSVLWLIKSAVSNIWKKRIGYIALCIILLVFFGIVMLGERATKFFVDDPTVALRADAYTTTWKYLVEENTLFGVGYNAYQFAAFKAGLLSDFTVHSRSGSDSSILTLFVTTGAIGVALFLAPMIFSLFWHGQKWLFTGQYYSLWFVWATIFILVHSQFINSLLYPHILLPYVIFAALIL